MCTGIIRRRDSCITGAWCGNLDTVDDRVGDFGNLGDVFVCCRGKVRTRPCDAGAGVLS